MKQTDPRPQRLRHLLTRFAKDEDGGIIILTLVLLVTMLVVAGMAVDFMRFESERAQLQSVSDRAVIAAAELEQTLDGKTVVNDFFTKAGYAENIVGEPIATDTGNSRSVSVRSQIDVNTFYLRLIGIDELTAPARSAAVEGVGKVEISMVLDISGSMRYGGSGSDGRFGDMQRAAIRFAEKVLDPVYNGQVSLNIIPYAGSTNPGPEMFAYLNGVRYNTYRELIATLIRENEDSGDPRDPEDMLEDMINDADILSLDVDGTTVQVMPNVSSCLEFAASDWTHSRLPGTGRAQVPHFMNWAIAADVMDWGWCPHDRSAIRYGLREFEDARDFINGIRMHDGTGTHYGIKWGLAALDPATQPAFAHLSAISTDLVPAEFANRPSAWDDSETRKILILMTDGQITEQARPKNALDLTNATNHLNNARRQTLTARSDNLTNFYAICDLAKSPSRDVEVYTVAFETYGSGKTEMENCASDPSMFYPAAGAQLLKVFEEIADQITDLRLTQ